MAAEENASFREQLRLLVRSLGILEKTDASGSAITITQCHALVEIGRRGFVSVSDLAAILFVDKSTMSRTIGHLERAGLVQKAGDEALGDRRVLAVRLTEHGKKAYEETEQSAQAYYQSVFDLIPQKEQSQVLKSLALVTGALAKARESRP